jgi:hypothetical protein
MTLARSVGLTEFRAAKDTGTGPKDLDELDLLRRGRERISVMPVSPAVYAWVLAKAKEPAPPPEPKGPKGKKANGEGRDDEDAKPAKRSRQQ